jgi:phage tail protein X
VWPPDEWAWRWSRFVLDRPGTVAVGEVARTCLAALPMTAAEAAALPRDWRIRTPDVVRRSRTTLALLRCAADDVPPPPPPAPGMAAWQPLLRHIG